MTVTLFGLLLFGMPGLTEILIIGGAVVLLFGATKLPKLGKGLGEGIRNFKSGLKGTAEENKNAGKGSSAGEKAIVNTEDSESNEKP